MSTAAEKPILFVGAPRSGTTVVFNAFADRPDLAWFPQVLSRFPRWPAVTTLTRLHLERLPGGPGLDRRGQRRLIGASEAYGVWRHYCGEKFLYDFLRGIDPSEEERGRVRALVAKVARYEGKPRFATKLTGPARIRYLSGIFPDARFVHVVRDGRAVVRSLLDVSFWQGTWRERRVSWTGGLSEDELGVWRRHGERPLVLAALQWRAIVRGAREEARRLGADQYAELRYEDFVGDAPRTLERATRFCDLDPIPGGHGSVSELIDVRDMNLRWREGFDARERELLDELLGDTLADFGYDPNGE